MKMPIKWLQKRLLLLETGATITDIDDMIDRGIRGKEKRPKPLGSESVHGLPLDWPEITRDTKPLLKQARKAPLGTQNVHGLPTTWEELDLSE